MSEWRDVSIADIGDVVTGRTPPARHPDHFGAEFPFVTPTDMDGRRMIASTQRSISHAGARAMPRQRIPARSVMVSCIGWQLGKAAITTSDSFTNQQLNTIVPGSDVDPLFVYYHLCTRREEIKLLASGGTRTPILNKSRFQQLRLKVPSLEDQRAIASVLGSIDDLIENNRRRIEVLEEMAQAIYREWFVHFRYPGHEDATFVDSPLGHIPEGWEVATLSQIAKVTRSSITPSKTPGSLFAHYSLPSFDDGERPVVEPGSEIRSGKFVLADCCILLSKLNPRIPRVWFVGELPEATAIASTEFLVLTPTQGSSLELIYLTVSESGFLERLQGLTGGTSGSHQRAKPGDVMAIAVLVPPPPVVESLVEVSRPTLELARTLNGDNLRLASMRDLLLPKLVTGEIDVSELDLDALLGAAS